MIGNQPSLTNNVASKTISVTATPGQTLFTVTGGYRINQLSVYRNGTRLVDSQDYTARDGATVTLLSPASGSDVIEFQIFDDFRVADALDVNSGGTVNGNVTVTGIVSATSFSGDGTNLTNTGSTLSAASGSQRLVLTSLTSGTMTASSTDADLTWNASTNTLSATNVSIAGTLTYEDVTNVDSVGLITARNGAIINAGTATTALIVSGNARVTGILTIGTSSVTLDGTNNQVNVGTGVTIHHTNGVQVGGNAVHSTGITVNNVNVTGILTAASFSGDGSGLTGVGGTSLTQGNTTAAVVDTGSDGRFVVTTEGSERLRIDSAGRIATGNAGFSTASLTASVTQYANLHLIGGAGTNNGSTIFIARNTPSTNAANQDLGNIYWGTNDGAPFARIGSWAEGTPTGSSYPGYLSFQTTPSGATAPTEKVRIMNDEGFLIGSTSSALNSSTDKISFGVGNVGSGNAHSRTRGIWMSNTIPASTTITVNLGSDQPSGLLIVTTSDDPYAPTQPWAAVSTKTEMYLVIPLRGGAAAGSQTLLHSVNRGTPHVTMTWTNAGTTFTLQNTNATKPAWYEVQYRL